MLRETSLTAYTQLIIPTLQQREEDVLNVIKKLGKATIYQVAEYMKVYPNSISGRFGSLEKKGCIKSVGKVKLNDNSNRTANLWEKV